MNMKFMKRGLTAFAVALLFAGTSLAQVEATGDYEEYDANVTAPTNIDYVTLNAGGTVMGYYAVPDATYHPLYALGGPYTLTAGFTWDWTIPTNPGAGASVTGGGAPANYVEITYTATGIYEVNVAETAPAGFGGCADATPTVMNVTVIGAPTAAITTADPAQACGDQVAMAVDIQIDETIAEAMASYAFAVQELVETIDPSDVVLTTESTNNTFVDFPTTGKLDNTDGGWSVITAGSQYGYQFNTSALAVIGGARTRYTYTLLEPSDLSTGSDGIVSAISEKSDYVNGSVRTHAFGDAQIVIIVNPAPSTGPIYHIPNDYAY
jgi:hypothetical protein